MHFSQKFFLEISFQLSQRFSNSEESTDKKFIEDDLYLQMKRFRLDIETTNTILKIFGSSQKLIIIPMTSVGNTTILQHGGELKLLCPMLYEMF